MSTTPSLPTPADALARLRVEDRQVVSRRHDDDSLIGPVRPIGQPASGELARRLLPANALVDPPLPDGLSGGRIDRRTPLRRLVATVIRSSIREERRRSIILILAVLARVPLPRDLERIEVGGVDLIERRVARAPRIGAPIAPFAGLVAAHQLGALLGARLSSRERAPRLDNRRGGRCEGNAPRQSASPSSNVASWLRPLCGGSSASPFQFDSKLL